MPNCQAAAFAILAALSVPAQADVVSDWYELNGAVSKASEPREYSFDPATAQAYSKTALAMFEAANAIDRRYTSYLKLSRAQKDADLAAAVNTAAYDVLTASYPGQKSMIEDAYAVAMADVPQGPARKAGVAVGHAAAKAALAAGGLDAARPVGVYRPAGAPGKFVPVSVPFDPRFSQMRPWFLTVPTEFRPAPPVALTSAEWAKSVDEVQRLGAKDSTERSATDTVRARFWANYDVAPMLRQVADQRGRSIVANARLYAMMEMGANDAELVLVDGKSHFGFWRPLSAIRGAGDDGNPATTPDMAWIPLLRTPSQPEYPCGHCVFAGMVAAIMEGEGPAPTGGVHFTNADFPGMFVTVPSYRAYADQVSLSRIYGGVHFRATNVVSQPIGDRLGKAVIARFAPPLP